MNLSISILNAKSKLDIVKKLNKANFKYYHIDVMDGKFVSNTSLPVEEIKEISSVAEKKLDIHLMVEDPTAYIEALKELDNIEYITIHLEIEKNILEILKLIKSFGFKAGISIKPNTDINLLVPYLDYLDLILVMSVEPGLGGQKFIGTTPERIKKIKSLIKGYNILIEVDGGINNNTIKMLKDTDLSVVGSYITTSDDPINQINSLLV